MTLLQKSSALLGTAYKLENLWPTSHNSHKNPHTHSHTQNHALLCKPRKCNHVPWKVYDGFAEILLRFWAPSRCSRNYWLAHKIPQLFKNPWVSLPATHRTMRSCEKSTRCDVLTSLFRIPRKRVQAATSELEKKFKLQLKHKCRKLPPQGAPDRHFQWRRKGHRSSDGEICRSY